MTGGSVHTTSDPLPRSIQNDLRRAVLGSIEAYEPLRLHVATVRDWFGQSWLLFEGKLHGALGSHSWPEAPLVIPPFHPNRIRTTTAFERDSAAAPWRPALLEPLNIVQTSEANLRRFFAKIAGTRALAVWLGCSEERARCALVYATHHDSESAWYADSAESGDFAPASLRGIRPVEFVDLIHRERS